MDSCGSLWIDVDRYGSWIDVNRCGSLWIVVDRYGSWIDVNRCGSLWMLIDVDCCGLMLIGVATTSHVRSTTIHSVPQRYRSTLIHGDPVVLQIKTIE